MIVFWKHKKPKIGMKTDVWFTKAIVGYMEVNLEVDQSTNFVTFVELPDSVQKRMSGVCKRLRMHHGSPY